MAQCFGSGFFGMIKGWISGKGKLLCVLLSAVECWFQEDLVFGEQKGKFKQLPGLGNRRSLFWVRSPAVCPLHSGERRMRKMPVFFFFFF